MPISYKKLKLVKSGIYMNLEGRNEIATVIFLRSSCLDVVVATGAKDTLIIVDIVHSPLLKVKLLFLIAQPAV